MKYRAKVFKDEKEQEEWLVKLKLAGVKCWTTWATSGDVRVMEDRDKKLNT